MKKLIPKRISKIQDAEKSEGDLALARARGISDAEAKLTKAVRADPPARKVVRLAARLADRITEDDRQKAVEVIRGAMSASITTYDPKKRALVELPDFKTQMAAATLLIAYDEGTPIKRVAAVVSHVDSEDMVARFRDSPEMLSVMKTISGLGMKLEVGGEVIEGDFSPVQESGGENPAVASEERPEE